MISLLTYNIHGLPWNHINVQEIADWIFILAKPKVICLQEVFSKKHRDYFVNYAEYQGYTAVYPRDTTCIPRMECGSGLLILLHPSVTFLSEPVFEPFQNVNGVDRLVSKGYFKVNLRHGLHDFQLFNTHMQSDVTEFWCYRLNYNLARSEQEKELFLAASKEDHPLVIGDMNMSEFECFEKLDPIFHVTFPGTDEHLDHLLVLSRDSNKTEHIETIYHENVPWSDHVPVIYTVRFQRRNPSRGNVATLF